MSTRNAQHSRSKKILDRQLVAKKKLLVNKAVLKSQEQDERFPPLLWHSCQDGNDPASSAFNLKEFGEEIESIRGRLILQTPNDDAKIPNRLDQCHPTQFDDSSSSIQVHSKGGKSYSIDVENNVLNLSGHESAEKCLGRNWRVRTLTVVDVFSFSRIQFEHLRRHLVPLLRRFSSVVHLRFVHTNIHSLHQLNLFGAIGPLRSIEIDEAGNPVTAVPLWRTYLVYRTAHIGLSIVNKLDVTKEEVAEAEKKFCCLATMAYLQLPLYRLSSLPVNPTCRNEFASRADSVKTSLQKDSDATAASKEHHSVSKAVLVYHHDDSNGNNQSQAGKLRQQQINSFTDECIRKSTNIKARQAKLIHVLDELLSKTVADAIHDYSDLVTYMKSGYSDILSEQKKQDSQADQFAQSSSTRSI